MQRPADQSEDQAQPRRGGIVVGLELTSAQLDLIADRVADRLRCSTAERPAVSAGELAALLGTSRDYVYEHAAALGGVRIGDGPRPRWRFDVERARRAYGRPDSPQSATGGTRRRMRRRPLPDGDGGLELLPVRGVSP